MADQDAESVAFQERIERLEQKLRESLEADRKHPSRCTLMPNGSTNVRPSGTSLGLAVAISLETGEDDADVMNRVGNDGGSRKGN